MYIQNKNILMENNHTSSDPGTIAKPEDNYIEADYRTVELCRSFMRDYQQDKILYNNPFTGRRIKRGTSTFSLVYSSVKKYLQNLDEEEFHSPIKNVVLHCKPAVINNGKFDEQEEYGINKDKIVHDWTEKAKRNMKTLFTNQEKSQKAAEKRELYQWRHDLIMDLSENFETKRSEWMVGNPELYSFLDTYKPEVLENKFLMNHIFLYEENPGYFITFLQTQSKSFLDKEYGYGVNRLNSDKRYSPAMVMFWIYADFLKNARKFLKKNTKKISEYLKSKTAPRLKTSHLNSLAIAHFLFHTPAEKLAVAKENYDKYFDDLLKTFFTWCNSESVSSKIYYQTKFCDYMGSKIKPYRYINFHYDDFARFDQIIDYVSNPIAVSEEQSTDVET